VPAPCLQRLHYPLLVTRSHQPPYVGPLPAWPAWRRTRPPMTRATPLPAHGNQCGRRRHEASTAYARFISSGSAFAAAAHLARLAPYLATKQGEYNQYIKLIFQHSLRCNMALTYPYESMKHLCFVLCMRASVVSHCTSPQLPLPTPQSRPPTYRPTSLPTATYANAGDMERALTVLVSCSQRPALAPKTQKKHSACSCRVFSACITSSLTS
jgi:hypothetical protein